MARPVPGIADAYWVAVRARARELGSDGCSNVVDWYLDACLEHDVHYRTHAWLDGTPITRKEADGRFRRVIQSRSWFGRYSPMAAWRWAGLRILGSRSWEEKGNNG